MVAHHTFHRHMYKNHQRHSCNRHAASASSSPAVLLASPPLTHSFVRSFSCFFLSFSSSFVSAADHAQELHRNLANAVAAQDFLLAHEIQKKIDEYRKLMAGEFMNAPAAAAAAAARGSSTAAGASAGGAGSASAAVAGKGAAGSGGDLSSVLAKAARRALDGGLAGASAMAIQVRAVF